MTPTDGAAARGNHMMSSILSRLFAGPAALAPAGTTYAEFAIPVSFSQFSMAHLFAGMRSRHGGDKGKQPSPDVALSWTEFGRGF
jgi:hypothetical protein